MTLNPTVPAQGYDIADTPRGLALTREKKKKKNQAVDSISPESTKCGRLALTYQQMTPDVGGSRRERV